MKKVYIDENNYDTEGDIFGYEMKIYQDDDGRYFVTGKGGAGTIFSKPDGPDSTRSGSLTVEIKKTGPNAIGSINQQFRLGLEVPVEYWSRGLKELYVDLTAAGYQW